LRDIFNFLKKDDLKKKKLDELTTLPLHINELENNNLKEKELEKTDNLKVKKLDELTTLELAWVRFDSFSPKSITEEESEFTFWQKFWAACIAIIFHLYWLGLFLSNFIPPLLNSQGKHDVLTKMFDLILYHPFFKVLKGDLSEATEGLSDGTLSSILSELTIFLNILI